MVFLQNRSITLRLTLGDTVKKAKTQIYDNERSGVYILENGRKKRFDSRRKAEEYLKQTREGHGARRSLGMASGKQPKTGWMQILEKGKATATHNSKGEKKDRCARIADRPSKYGPKGSAYKSGAIVQCRQGKIWRDEK